MRTFEDWLTYISAPGVKYPASLKALLERAYDAGFQIGAVAVTDALAKKRGLSRRAMTRKVLRLGGLPDPAELRAVPTDDPEAA